MRKSKAHKYSFILILLMNLLCLGAAAQQGFRFKATLDTVRQDGFYKIMLTPAIVAACQPPLGDIRIKDNKDSIVPFILQQLPSSATARSVTDLPLIKTKNTNQVILQNNTPGGISELLLFIKNTSAYRYATLSGSDDTSHWFVVQENILLANNDSSTDAASFSQLLHFPYSSYYYFKLSLNSNDALPMNVFKVEIYNTKSTVNSAYDTIPKPQIIQHDSDKMSYIKLQFDKHYRIDKLSFLISGAKFFNRPFTVYNNTLDNVYAAGNITSSKPVENINLQAKTNSLWIVINNGDNNPLKIDDATAYQLPVTLITYLNAGKNYSLFFGDSAVRAAVYDLMYFNDSAGSSNKILAIKKIYAINTSAPAKKAADNHLNTYLLWSIIIAVLLLLIYFSFTLLKDINRKTTNTDAHL